MDSFSAIIAISAVTVLLLGLVSGYIRNRLWISEPAICLAVGMLLSPLEFELLGVARDSDAFLELIKQAARVTLGISVLGAAMRLPEGYISRNWRELMVVLGLGLPLMCAAGSAVALSTLQFPLLISILIGCVLAPTDPVLADSIVTGRTADEYIPSRLRNMITAESGANDGLAVLLVMIPVLLLGQPPDEAARYWLTETLLWHVVVAAAIGAGIGWLSGRALVWAYAKPYSENVSGLTVSLALALSTVAVVHLMGGSGVLAAFVAGLMFKRFLEKLEDPRHEHIQEAIGRFFDLPIFILFGLALPWDGWSELGPAAWLFVVLILALRRPPAWLLLQPLLRSLGSHRAALFTGWFGPIGVAALYYAAEASQRTNDDRVWNIASLVVFASIVMHGMSATPLVSRCNLMRKRGASSGAEDGTN